MELHEFPDGWNLVIAHAIIKHDLCLDLSSVTCQQSATDRLMSKAGVCPYIMDHWGTTAAGDLVCEPYGNHDEDARRLASYLYLELTIGEPAEWNSSCRRYRFHMPMEVFGGYDSAFNVMAELIDACHWEFRERCKSQDANEAIQKSMRPSAN